MHFSESPLSPSIYHCFRLFTAITTCLPSLPTVSASAASTSACTSTSAAVHRRLLLPLVLHHQKQN
jgi:hypothetical protein